MPHDIRFTFDHAFTHVGTFWYYCQMHGFDNGDGTADGMAGTITMIPGAALLAGMAGSGLRPGWIGGRVRSSTHMSDTLDRRRGQGLRELMNAVVAAPGPFNALCARAIARAQGFRRARVGGGDERVGGGAGRRGADVERFTRVIREVADAGAGERWDASSRYWRMRTPGFGEAGKW